MNKFFTFLFLSILTLSSCHDSYDICDKPKNVVCKAGFYQIISGTETVSSVSSLTFAVIDGNVLYDKKNAVASFSFSLSKVDSVKYSIKLADVLPADTLTLFYTNKNEVISAECGNVNTHNILKYAVTNNTIDSLKISNPTVNTTSGENLRIYY